MGSKDSHFDCWSQIENQKSQKSDSFESILWESKKCESRTPVGNHKIYDSKCMILILFSSMFNSCVCLKSTRIFKDLTLNLLAIG